MPPGRKSVSAQNRSNMEQVYSLLYAWVPPGNCKYGSKACDGDCVIDVVGCHGVRWWEEQNHGYKETPSKGYVDRSLCSARWNEAFLQEDLVRIDKPPGNDDDI